MKIVSIFALLVVGIANAQLSHPPLQTIPEPVNRKLPAGPIYYVDSAKGSDANPGSETEPW